MTPYFIPPPQHYSLFSIFSELFWRTVCAMGLCQEGWEPHEEPIWEYYCMCVQSTSWALMSFCVPFPFFRLIYWPGLWLWITISCSNRVLLSANESSFDLSNLLLYSSSCGVFSVMRNKPFSVWHITCSLWNVYKNVEMDFSINSYYPNLSWAVRQICQLMLNRQYILTLTTAMERTRRSTFGNFLKISLKLHYIPKNAKDAHKTP